jgi:hypothetical protein
METKEKRRTSPSAGRAGQKRPAAAAGQRKPTSARSSAANRPRTAEKPAQKPAASEIVYTQPRPFNRRQLLLQLSTVAAVVLALLFGMAIFFKVDESKIMVSGVNKYTEMQIREASGIRDGENLLLLSDAKVSASIISQLPYVKSVRVGIKLPDTVQIEIVELDVVYSIEADDGSWWLISASGDVIEQTNGATAAAHTKISGVKLSDPQVGQKAKAAEESTDNTTPEGETAPVTVLGSERLQTVISILEYMEDSGIIGKAASLNVSDMGAIEFWYGQQYRVKLGDTTQLGYKVKTAAQAIRQLVAKNGQYHTGVLDASYTTWPDEINFAPLS